MFGDDCVDGTDTLCCATCSFSLSTSSSNSWFLFSTRSILLDRRPASSSLTFLSKFSICSLVLCLIFRCASRSFARFRASWALLRWVTDRFPPLAPVGCSQQCPCSQGLQDRAPTTIPFFRGSSTSWMS